MPTAKKKSAWRTVYYTTQASRQTPSLISGTRGLGAQVWCPIFWPTSLKLFSFGCRWPVLNGPILCLGLVRSTVAAHTHAHTCTHLQIHTYAAHTHTHTYDTVNVPAYQRTSVPATPYPSHAAVVPPPPCRRPTPRRPELQLQPAVVRSLDGTAPRTRRQGGRRVHTHTDTHTQTRRHAATHVHT